jgi:dTDP-glucose 4,6-dehydratase
MRVLVTGGAGFIGSHLCERLVNEGHTVVCVDNFITGCEHNVAHLMQRDTFRLIRHNMNEHLQIPGPLDLVFHFASPASPIDYMRFPIHTMKVGSIGTLNALGIAKAKGARFLLASTSEVYGDPQVHPQPESYWGHVNPIGPRGVYDEAKRFGEALTMAYHREHGLHTHIVRIFNTYGPRMRVDDGRAIPTFLSQALAGEPITIFGDGKQTRSFGFITDLVEGILRLTASETHEPVNIGNPEERTLLELAETIVRMTRSKSRLEFKALPEDDPKVRCPDITKARTLLGWQPRVDLETGLSRTIPWFEEALK